MQRRTGRPCTADNVVLTPGTQGGLFCSLNCLAGPGDEVILPEPIYGPYAGVIGATGARMVNVPLRAEKGFHPDLDSLARAVTPQTRVIWINSPHNPTGAVFTADEIAGIAELCRQHDLWLVSDEVYEDLAFARPHISPWSLPEMAERTIVASSLSKSHAMAGFRFGWVIGPPALSRYLFDFLLCMYFGGPAFIQDGALAALGSELPEVGAQRETYRRRALLLTLGEFNDTQLPNRQRQPLIEKLLTWFENEPDPGLHAATEWLLRKWDQNGSLQTALEKLQVNETQWQARRANDEGVELSDLAVTPADVARVQALVDEGAINDKLARQVFDGLFARDLRDQLIQVERERVVVVEQQRAHHTPTGCKRVPA